MKNGELEKLLTPPEIISDQHKDNIIKLNEYNNKLKIYLVENYFKKPDILLIYLKKIGAEKIISISENIELLHRIFSNIVFFDYFKDFAWFCCRKRFRNAPKTLFLHWKTVFGRFLFQNFRACIMRYPISHK